MSGSPGRGSDGDFDMILARISVLEQANQRLQRRVEDLERELTERG